MDAWADRKTMVCGGDCLVSGKSSATLSTVLGSCIAACIYDPVAGIGGMNHYLLPYNSGATLNARYGEDAFPHLLRKLGRRGADRGRLLAKLYGGARILPGEADIGQANIDFAEMFLRDQGIPIVDTDLGGQFSRWIDFYPASGRSLIKRTRSRSLITPEPVANY